MNPSEKRACIAGVSVLAEAFGRKLSETTHRAYQIGLNGLTAEQIERATELALATCKFMPTPAELRERVAGSVADRAVEAWEDFTKAVERIGSYKTVDFDDKVINAVVRSLGGWEQVCAKTGDEFDKWLRKDFLAAYEAYARRGVGDEAAAPLIGFFDRENAAGGYPSQKNHTIAIECKNPTDAASKIEQKRADVPRIDLKKA